jgi:hypothetical protein
LRLPHNGDRVLLSVEIGGVGSPDRCTGYR